MTSFKLSNNESQLISENINEIIINSKIIAEQYLTDKKLKKLNIFLKNLEKFEETLSNTRVYHEKLYLPNALGILKIFKEIENIDSITKLILDFSKVNSKVRNIYKDLNLEKRLIKYIGKNKYSYNHYNDTIIKDYFYSYCYWEADKKLKNEGLLSFLNYLKNDERLGKSESQLWIRRSILSSQLDRTYFSKDELSLILKELDNNLTQKVKKILKDFENYGI